MAALKASFKLTLFFIWSILLVPPQLVLMMAHKGPHAYIIPHLWHKGVCAILGLKYNIIGTPHKDHQTLFMSNHLSYLDIPVIGSLLKASFVAKKEVASWPVFGFLSRLQQTEFLDRRRTAIQEGKDAIAARLDNGRSLVIFPEGTSTDGQSVLPFKSSLFALALGPGNEDLYLQPLTVRLEQAGGKAPDTQDVRDLYAWHRDMDTDLAMHLWRFARSSGARLTLVFHEPIAAAGYTDRKTLAKTCHEDVSKGLEMANAA